MPPTSELASEKDDREEEGAAPEAPERIGYLEFDPADKAAVQEYLEGDDNPLEAPRRKHARYTVPAEALTAEAEATGDDEEEESDKQADSDDAGADQSRRILPKDTREEADISWHTEQDLSAEEPPTIMQLAAPTTKSIPEQMHRGCLESAADYWSAWSLPVQEDGGANARAAADAFHQRVQHQDKEVTKEADQVAPPEEAMVVCEFSDSGKGLQDFMQQVREKDQENGTTVAARTKAVLFCTPERIAQLQESGAVPDSVELREVDYANPATLQMPDNTVTVLIDGVTNTHTEAHTIVSAPAEKRPINQGLFDAKPGTEALGTEPLVVIDPETGRIDTVDSFNWSRESHDAAEKDRSELTPQLIGRTIVTQHFNLDEPVQHEGTPLEEKDRDVRNFMKDGAHLDQWGYNYSPQTEALLEAIVGGIRRNGFVVVGGHFRRDASLRLRMTTLIQQERELLPKTEDGTQPYVPTAPLIVKLTEAEHLRNGAEAADENATVTFIGDGRGRSYDCYIIDRASADTASKTKETIEAGVVPKGPQAGEVLSELGQELRTLRKARVAPDKIEEFIENKVTEAIQGNKDTIGNPALASNYDFCLGVALFCNNNQAPGLAQKYASEAARLLPMSSAAQHEIARAALATGDVRLAKEAIRRGIELSPQNAALYYTRSEIANQEGDTEAEVMFRRLYLRHAANLSPQETAVELVQLCKAVRNDYARQAVRKDGGEPFKTVVEYNLVTNEYHAIQISKVIAKQIQAADTVIMARQAINELLSHNPNYTQQDLNEIAMVLNDIWEEVCPTEADQGLEGLPTQPAENCRWVYVGRLDQGDEEVSPEELAFIDEGPLDKPDEDTPDPDEIEGLDVTDIEIDPTDPRKVAQSEIPLGKILGPDGVEGTFSLPLKSLNHHIALFGKTGGGKTTTIEAIAEEGAKLGAGTLMVDIGDKDGLKEVSDNLTAKGIPFSIIAPGVDEAIPVSIDMFTPVGDTTAMEQVGSIVSSWQGAFEMNDPFVQVLELSLIDTFGQCGYDVEYTGRHAKYAVQHQRLKQPLRPTMEMLRANISRRASIYVGDARNIDHFFETRCNYMSSGELASFLSPENSNVIDWDAMVGYMNGATDKPYNIYLNLSRIKNKDKRLFMMHSFVNQFNLAVQRRGRSTNKAVKNIVIIDEAGLLVDIDTASVAGKQAVKSNAENIKVLRAYGVCVVISAQTPHMVYKEVRGNTGIQINHALKLDDDIQAVKGDVGMEDEQQRGMRELEPGEAYAWKDGMEKPVKIRVIPRKPPSKEALEKARASCYKVPPPIKKGPNMRLTHKELKEVQAMAASQETSLLRLAVGVVTVSHVAHIDLPSKVPQELKDQWRQMSAKNRKRAELVARTMVQEAIRERAVAVGAACNPALLGESILRATVGLLEGHEPQGPGRKPAINFAAPEVLWAKEYVKNKYPYNRRAPKPRSVATPTEGLKREDARKNETVAQQTESLLRHELSPRRSPRTTEMVWRALLGEHANADFWDDVKDFTKGEPVKPRRRRQLAAAFGYLPNGDEDHPSFSEFEAAFTLPKVMQAEFKDTYSTVA